MSDFLIILDHVGKKFSRDLQSGLIYGASDLVRKFLKRGPRQALRRNEFWAIQDISFAVRRGECLGIIGPNGAGKTTLLKMINREYRPDAGTIATYGATQSLIRIGAGLQPMLSGRENIYIQCFQLGLDKREIDRRLDDIVAFAELDEAIDRPVKTYSDGMYSRLEFSITTAVPMDVLLVDEVLAVGDIAFQMRCLDRLNRLKLNGAAIVFVSHSEMNVRQVSDRCLLLFNGRQVGLGETDSLFYKYYESIGYLNRKLEPLGAACRADQEHAGDVAIQALRFSGAALPTAKTGGRLELSLSYRTARKRESVSLTLQFWNSAQFLVASIDSRLGGTELSIAPDSGEVLIRVPFLCLTPGLYKVSATLTDAQEVLAHRNDLLELAVTQDQQDHYPGLAVLPAVFEQG